MTRCGVDSCGVINTASVAAPVGRITELAMSHALSMYGTLSITNSAAYSTTATATTHGF
jgi:hypothetical protein